MIFYIVLLFMNLNAWAGTSAVTTTPLTTQQEGAIFHCLSKNNSQNHQAHNKLSEKNKISKHTLSRSEHKLIITDETQIQWDDRTAVLDSFYLSKKRQKQLKQRYVSFELESGVEGKTEILIQKKLLKRANSGVVKIENQGEGWVQENYICRKK